MVTWGLNRKCGRCRCSGSPSLLTSLTFFDLHATPHPTQHSLFCETSLRRTVHKVALRLKKRPSVRQNAFKSDQHWRGEKEIPSLIGCLYCLASPERHRHSYAPASLLWWTALQRRAATHCGNFTELVRHCGYRRLLLFRHCTTSIPPCLTDVPTLSHR